jgi:hypothetical protein
VNGRRRFAEPKFIVNDASAIDVRRGWRSAKKSLFGDSGFVAKGRLKGRPSHDEPWTPTPNQARGEPRRVDWRIGVLSPQSPSRSAARQLWTATAFAAIL